MTSNFLPMSYLELQLKRAKQYLLSLLETIKLWGIDLLTDVGIEKESGL